MCKMDNRGLGSGIVVSAGFSRSSRSLALVAQLFMFSLWSLGTLLTSRSESDIKIYGTLREKLTPIITAREV